MRIRIYSYYILEYPKRRRVLVSIADDRSFSEMFGLSVTTMISADYNRNGARWSIGVGLPFRLVAGVVDTDVSDAPEGFLDSFKEGGSGVLDPLDGVLVLAGTPLAGLTRPVGVRGRELEPFTDKRFPDTLLCLLEVGVFPVVLTAVLRGMRLTFVESVLSNDCVEP